MDIRNILGKSIYSLNMQELEALLEFYEKDQWNYFDKIERVKSAIVRLENKMKNPKNITTQWEKDALEMVALIEKWERLGCNFKSIGTLTVWYYKDIEFYRWWSGSYVSDNIIEARKGDEYLQSILEGEKAG